MQERQVDPGIGIGEISEDCLTLNVFGPPATKTLHPVMVFFHGGGFTQGSASAALFDGTYLAQQGVVIVTCNYRLGRFGFFAHPALTREANGDPVANYGLMDQIAALKWVRDNIAAFGGDSGKVTIFGESAGGISVNNLMISPLARGLFRAAIAESSFGRERTETLAEAETSGTQAAHRWGVTSETTEALRKIPASAIIAVDAKDQPFSFFLDGHVPIIDGQVVPESVMSGFSAGHEAAVPFIIGVNELELPPAFPPPSLESRAPSTRNFLLSYAPNMRRKVNSKRTSSQILRSRNRHLLLLPTMHAAHRHLCTGSPSRPTYCWSTSPPLHTAPNYHTFSRLTEVPFSQRGPATLA